MGCGSSSKKTQDPTIYPSTPAQANPNTRPQPIPNPPRSQPNPNPPQSQPNPNPPRPQANPNPMPSPPAHTFPTTYNADSTFQLQVKDLTGVLDFRLDLQARLTGKELFQRIGAEMRQRGEQREFQVVVFGRPIKCDEEEIGKSGLSENGVAYCIFKPNN